MTKLLVIADDFTGALDTGVQFAGKGIVTKVLGRFPPEKDREPDTAADVWVINAETRHLSAEEAYQRVFQIVRAALKYSIPYFYKKTDSGLRGNIGAELMAALDASTETYLTFIPALPGMNRITVNGIHYADGIPIRESAFGRDPFEPVGSSYVPDLFRDLPVQVRLYPRQKQYLRGKEREIGIFDAASDTDIKAVVDGLTEQRQMGIMAGCAGFASAIVPLLGPGGKQPQPPVIPRQMLIVCGSVNEITRQQIEYAERNGLKRITLTPGQQLDPGYPESDAGRQWLMRLKEECGQGQTCILETGISGAGPMDGYREEHDISLEQARRAIAGRLGTILKKLLEMGLESTIMIIGGDTLAGFVSRIGGSEISICQELEPGTVLSSVSFGGKKHWLISKSGGFGSAELLVDIDQLVKMAGS